MRYAFSIVLTMALALGMAWSASAQTADLEFPDPGFCDPLLSIGPDETEDDGDEEDILSSLRRYDQEESEALKTEQAIMDALYEEKWDLVSGDEIARTEMCGDHPSYVVLWAEMISGTDPADISIIAKGMFQFKKDGTFQFVFKNRPYVGQWSVSDLRMSLTADWLNDAAPVVAPVEHVWTPVELTYADGATDSYVLEHTRVGPFRFLRIATTVKGAIQDCACGMQ